MSSLFPSKSSAQAVRRAMLAPYERAERGRARIGDVMPGLLGWQGGHPVNRAVHSAYQNQPFLTADLTISTIAVRTVSGKFGHVSTIMASSRSAREVALGVALPFRTPALSRAFTRD